MMATEGQPFIPTDVYVDGLELAASAYTVSLIFTLNVGPDATRPQATIRMSLQHAKMMAIQFKRAVKEIEQELGPVSLPTKVLQEKGIELERDW